MTTNVLKKFGFIRIALAASVGLPLLIVTSANAQNPAASPAAEATTERVVVTGSNIPTTETESALPVTVYSAEVLQKIGANTPAEGLRQLPSYVGNTATENDSNGGNGSAAVTLRGLGPNNVLTLINFRRALLAERTNGFSDINAIPISAVSRVEILKDGDSSVYGSDAVAGVVNFILLNGPGEAPYQGGEVFSLYGNTTTKDARVIQGWARGGVTALDGKVSIAAAGEYYNRLDLFSRDRFISSHADNRFLGGANGASPTYPGRVTYRTNTADTTHAIAATLVDQTTQNPKGSSETTYQDDTTNSYRLFDAAGPSTDPDRFNFRAFTPAIPGQEKADYYVTGRYKVFDDMFQIYGDVLYAKTKQNNGLAPSPFSVTNTRVVNSSPFNPFLDPDKGPTGTLVTSTADDQLRSVAYRLIQELGNRRTLYDADYYRYTIGFNGEFNMTNNQFVSNWGYDSGFVYSRYQNIRTDSGDAKRSYIQAAITGTLDALTGDPNDSFLFFNPFIGESAPVAGTANTYDGKGYAPTGTAAYDNALVVSKAAFIARSIFKERDFLYDVKGHAQFFPELYQGGIGAALGYGHQHSATETIPDPTQGAGDQLGFNQQALIKYVQEVNAVFGEVQIPIIASTQNLSWMRSVIFGFAYRYEEFEDRDQFNQSGGLNLLTFNNGGNPRISLRIQPIEDLVIRASWGQSFRSPSPGDLFAPATTQDFPQLFDPLVSGVLQPPQGVFEFGNQGLRPEKTDSYSAGIVYSPTWVRNLTGGSLTWSVDFYQMFTRDLIVSGANNAAFLLLANANSNNTLFSITGAQFGDPNFIGVFRDPGNGSVQGINANTTNAGKRLVNGMDVNTVYQLPTSNWGTFTWTLGYNYFFTWKAEAVVGGGFHSFLGDYNNGTIPLAPGAIPYHKGFLRGEWEWRGFDFVMTGNYISSFNDDAAFLLSNIGLVPSGGLGDPNYAHYRRVGDYMTLDMQLAYTFKKPVTEAVATSYAKDAKDAKDGKSAPAPVGGVADNGTFAQRMLWNTTITVGVNNAFDRQPPTAIGAFNDNYDTSLYSIRDRYYYISLGKKF